MKALRILIDCAALAALFLSAAWFAVRVVTVLL